MRWRRRRRLQRWIRAALFLFPALACTPREPPEVLAVRARLSRETAQLAAELDGLETRLTEDRARVEFFRELAVRHHQVSAIACQNLDGHAAAMRHFATREHNRFRAQRERRLARADATAGSEP